MCFSNVNLLTPFLAAVGSGGWEASLKCVSRGKEEEEEKKLVWNSQLELKTRQVTLDPAVSGRRCSLCSDLLFSRAESGCT